MTSVGTLETWTPSGWRLARVVDGEVVAMVRDVNRVAAHKAVEEGVTASARACAYAEICHARETLRKSGTRA